MKFPLIRLLTFNHNKSLRNCQGVPGEITCSTIFFLVR